MPAKTASSICAVLLCVLALPAAAADFSANMFGHQVAIVSSDDQEKLTVDGKELHSNRFLLIDTVDVIGGIPTIVLISADGGNACPGDPLVISFPEGGAPRIDDPIEDCRGAASVTKESDHLLLATAAVPGQPSVRWTWTPGKGFAEAGKVDFKPDTSKGWSDAAKANHPADLLGIAPIAEAANALLGKDRQEFEDSITGPGSGEFKKGFYIGDACMPHACTIAEALIAADVQGRKLYLAWKPANKKIVVRPDVKEWPTSARAALKDWSSKWK